MTVKKATVFAYFIAMLFSPALYAFTGPINPHPRLLLTPSLVRDLRARATANTAEWQRLKKQCDSGLTRLGDSGYYGGQWADLLATFALCYVATGASAYAAKAVVYADALANDKTKAGDSAGGDLRVRDGNSGYSIRYHGVYLALAYDWLYDYLSASQPEKLTAYRTRLYAWTTDYETYPITTVTGYLRDFKRHGGVSNYYMAYFLTKALTGYATYESAADTVAAAHIDGASAQFATIRSTFDTKLKGGDFPEGWMYGAQAINFLVKSLLSG